MEWIPSLLLLLGVLVVAVPVAVYFGAVVLLWASSLVSLGPAVSRTRFSCPVTKRLVTADFLTESGSDRPSDVLSCSIFAQADRVRCQKSCLGFAETRSVSMSLLPRFSLISGGTAYRVAASPAPGGAPARKAA
jgi:hypothetical protein